MRLVALVVALFSPSSCAEEIEEREEEECTEERNLLQVLYCDPCPDELFKSDCVKRAPEARPGQSSSYITWG